MKEPTIQEERDALLERAEAAEEALNHALDIVHDLAAFSPTFPTQDDSKFFCVLCNVESKESARLDVLSFHEDACPWRRAMELISA